MRTNKKKRREKSKEVITVSNNDNSGSYRTASITVTIIDDFSSQITALEKRVKVLEDSVRSLSRPDTAIFDGATVTHESPYKHRIKIPK